jgi:hypothetical protein
MRTTNPADRMKARYIPKGANCILEHENGSALYTYEAAGKFYVIAFWGTSGKSQFHECYRVEAQRDQRVIDWKRGVESSVAFRTERKAKKSAWVNPLKVGEILHSSWGYDQTNVEFYVVTKVSGKRVWIRQIASDYEATGHMCGNTWPAMPIRFVGEETMHIAQPNGDTGASVKVGHQYASQETGRMHYTSSYA